MKPNADSGTATDAVGSFDGTYTDGAGSFIFGASTGIPHETDPGVGLTNGSTIKIPYALELNPDAAWSAETWVQPYSLGANGNGDYRVVFFLRVRKSLPQSLQWLVCVSTAQCQQLRPGSAARQRVYHRRPSG